MSKVLLLVGHPDLAHSRHHAALVDSVKDLTHVTVHDLSAAYPDLRVDGDAERALLLEHDVVVFQHPLYWYNVTPVFKQWQDVVLTKDWAYNFPYSDAPTHTTGKKAIVAVTTGGPAEAYTPEGIIGRTLDDVLFNWVATLRLCHFDIQPMFTLSGADPVHGVPVDELTAAGARYRELLASFA